MAESFEDILEQCIASVTDGRYTVEECLTRYPQWADRLEPLLRLASELPDAFAAEPSPVRQAESRRRFMTAAHRQRRATPARRRLIPAVSLPFSLPRWPPALPQRIPRPLVASLAVLLVALVSFSSFLFATSSDALPGDWRYPVKRTSERVRFAFVFGDDARRSFRIQLTEERLDELQALAERGRSLDEPLIRELIESTESLVQELNPLDPVSVPQEHVERIGELTTKEQEVFDRVEPLIEEDAADDLTEARQVSSEGQARALTILSLASSQEQQVAADESPTAEPATPLASPGEGTPEATAAPGQDITATPPADDATPTGTETGSGEPTPESTPSPDATATPGVAGSETPSVGTPEPTAEPTPVRVAREVVSLPEDVTGGVKWSQVTVDDFSVRLPDDAESGWALSSPSPGQAGETLVVGHRGASGFDAAIAVSVSNGTVSVHALVDGAFQRIGVDDVAATVPSLAEIVDHVLESITDGSS